MQKVMALSARLHSMAFDPIRRRHPNWNESQVQIKFIEVTYWKELSEGFEKCIAELGFHQQEA